MCMSCLVWCRTFVQHQFKNSVMRNFKIQLVSLAALLLGLNNIDVNAGYSLIPTYFTVVSSGSDSYFSDLACNAQFLKFNEAELEMDSHMELDASLELESWMMETGWSEGMEHLLESELEIENWMIDYNWMESSDSFHEPDLKMESWMSQPKNWNLNPTN